LKYKKDYESVCEKKVKEKYFKEVNPQGISSLKNISSDRVRLAS